jgi:hypothetical protein
MQARPYIHMERLRRDALGGVPRVFRAVRQGSRRQGPCSMGGGTASSTTVGSLIPAMTPQVPITSIVSSSDKGSV